MKEEEISYTSGVLQHTLENDKYWGDKTYIRDYYS